VPQRVLPAGLTTVRQQPWLVVALSSSASSSG
jgi:hypothetical protein